MKNYLCIDGKKVELTDEQVAEISRSFGAVNTRLSDVAKGETFKIGKYEFVVLEHSRDTTAVILKDFLFDKKGFGRNNNYNGSYVDGLCNAFAATISAIIGKENLVEHTVDLTADDGLKDYGKVRRSMSILTANLYRRYVETLDRYKMNKWWWLATAFSTPAHNDSACVTCVSPSCSILHCYYRGDFGVRPFCILNSDIFVSK